MEVSHNTGKPNPLRYLRQRVPNYLVNNTYHLAKAVFANLYFGFPSKKLILIGVTGTKGKTSTAHLLHHILLKSNFRVVLISTVGAQFNAKKIDTGLHVTNPDPFVLQKLLRQAVNQDFQYVILEVTSHGLDQNRNWGIFFDLAIFTQVKVDQDHLDYHGSARAYQTAKAKLIKQAKKIILNQHDPSYSYLKNMAEANGKKVFSYQSNTADFQAQNLSAALCAAGCLGIGKEEAMQAIKDFPGVPGRMEYLQKKPFSLVIDFAHTPDSLRLALLELRKQVVPGRRLIAVFGCAGERDPNRRKMGRIAAQYSDLFLITAEDPRSENLDEINKQIANYAGDAGAIRIENRDLAGFKPDSGRHAAKFAIIPDRQSAINEAVRIARNGDVVGLFGKGHEKSMCFGTREVPWSEHQAVKKALNNKR